MLISDPTIRMLKLRRAGSTSQPIHADPAQGYIAASSGLGKYKEARSYNQSALAAKRFK